MHQNVWRDRKSAGNLKTPLIGSKTPCLEIIVPDLGEQKFISSKWVAPFSMEEFTRNLTNKSIYEPRRSLYPVTFASYDASLTQDLNCFEIVSPLPIGA